MNKTVLGFIIANSCLLAAGVILVFVSCVQYDNWWPILTIFINAFAILFPTFCNGCHFGDDMEDMWDEADTMTLGAVSWVFLGFFVVIGYAIPIELLRGKLISQAGVYFTLAGGTIVLASILIFIRLIYFRKDGDSAYFF